MRIKGTGCHSEHLPAGRPVVGRLHPRHDARRVDLDVVRPCLALRTTPCQATPCSAGPHPWAAWPPISRQWGPSGCFKLENSFSIFFRFQLKFILWKFVYKYPELQKLWNQFCWICNFLIYPMKLIRETETFSLNQFLLKLEQLSVYLFFRPSSSHVGPDVDGLILKEEKVEQEVPRGS
jgi:hypothetical protein